MPPLGPISRRDLIACLRRLGFDGPYSGGRHQYMLRGSIRLRIPNPHQADIGRAFLLRILDQAGIDRHQWEAL